MNFVNIKFCIIGVLGICITACSVAKLEARLEANPQCKEVVNPKTSAVMPCPGSDKAFYKSVGLEPTKTTPTAASAAVITSNTPASPAESATPQAPKQATQPMLTDCKPTLHKKTGGILPCPSPN
jgi:hypothetical protein